MLRALLLIAAIALGAQAAAQSDAPPRPNAQRPPVELDPSHDELGRVFRVVEGGRTPEIAFVSDAPLEHFVGECHSVGGYAVISGRHDLVALNLTAPVAAFTTGIPMRDEHLTGDRWLNADDHPNLRFQLADARGFTEINAARRFTTLVGDLVGDLTVAGVTRELVAPATLVFMPETESTQRVAPGNLIAIRAAFDVALDDFGVGAGDPARRTGAVAETIRVQVRLVLSDSPDAAPHATRTPEPDQNPPPDNG